VVDICAIHRLGKDREWLSCVFPARPQLLELSWLLPAFTTGIVEGDGDWSSLEPSSARASGPLASTWSPKAIGGRPAVDMLALARRLAAQRRRPVAVDTKKDRSTPIGRRSSTGHVSSPPAMSMPRAEVSGAGCARVEPSVPARRERSGGTATVQFF
jgi:hypothetical protein